MGNYIGDDTAKRRIAIGAIATILFMLSLVLLEFYVV